MTISLKEHNKDRVKKIKKKYYENNKAKILAAQKDYYQNNKHSILESHKIYNENNKDKKKIYDKEYREKNKNKRLIYNKQYNKDKRKKDLTYNLRCNISKCIWEMLIIQKSSKKKRSCWKFLPYTPEELKTYIRSKYEHWMNDQNYGKYNSNTWTDDPITWTWQLDHIIPQSELPYSSMDEENFKKCWALDNLRPYSAKQNSIDGATHIRHNI